MTAVVVSPAVSGRSDAALNDADRAAVWRTHGAEGSEVAELLDYARNEFVVPPAFTEMRFPIDDEPFVSTWDSYVETSRSIGVVATLRPRLVQLSFPIGDGVSRRDDYLNATRRGVPHQESDGLAFADAGGVRMFVHPTPAGRVPVIVAAARADFESLVRALTMRNEPVPVPPAMGACIVAGYNNWDRVRRLRETWEAEQPWRTSNEDWATAFRAIVPHRDLYQDRFILLSSGPYSAVPAAALGLSDADWSERSLAIRLEHECTHYFTRRVLGSMRNALLDELVADYVGLVVAGGRYRAAWFLSFMGLEQPHAYRVGGRLERYRGTPPLSDGAFAALQSVVRCAATSLEACDAMLAAGMHRLRDRAMAIVALTRIGLESLATVGAQQRVEHALREMRASNFATLTSGDTKEQDGVTRFSRISH